MAETLSLDAPGAYAVGCNYWASHAGAHMWSDWRPDVVEQDLKLLSAAGLQVLRVFPLWPDFQPLTLLRGWVGREQEFRLGEQPLGDDEAGHAGVCPEAIVRFRQFADLAGKYNLKLLVGLVTGWMSGRLFVPPAFEGRNVITDPLAIQWQVRFVRYFVKQFRQHPAVLGWDLGNECNCMGAVASPQQAWLWTNAIVSAIRAEDRDRPVVSGMHSLSPTATAAWRIQDQAELTDVLTTHPYPLFTQHCDRDPLNTMRSCLHATAESRLYADIGGKPCLAEEVGTLGPMMASEKIAADYVRTALFSTWAHDCHGLLWWCAHDQTELSRAPYDWSAVERELGLFRTDGNPKPVAQELTRFVRFLQGLPIQRLPECTKEAVCILSEGQDQWGAAFASFILAKQAGFDLRFAWAEAPLPQADLYIMPAVGGTNSLSRRAWLGVLDRVRRGATLYLSCDDALLAPFSEPFGVEVQTRSRRTGPAAVRFEPLADMPAMSLGGAIRLDLTSVRAHVLAREEDGNPILTCAEYGQGKAYFLALPLEQQLVSAPGVFHGPQARPHWRIYQHVAGAVLARRAVRKTSPQVGLTEHPLEDRRRVVVAINYSPQRLEESLALAEGWSVESCWRGQVDAPSRQGVRCTVDANDAVVFVIAS